MNTQKKKKLNPLSILRIFLGTIFLSAGIFRLIFFQSAVQEFSTMNLPAIFVIFAIIIEISLSVMLLSRYKLKIASIGLGIFVCGGIIISLLNITTLDFSELFKLTFTPTNIFLHITYLIGIITIFLSLKNKN